MFQIYRGLWLLREERPLLFCTFLSTFFLSLAALGKAVLDKYQCCGSVTFWYRYVYHLHRSGSCFFRQWLTKCQQKISFCFPNFFYCIF